MTDTNALAHLTDQASGLIRDEVRAAESRYALERACVQAILRDGHSIDAVSAASGLPPKDIKRALEFIPPMDEDLGTLFGLPALPRELVTSLATS